MNLSVRFAARRLSWALASVSQRAAPGRSCGNLQRCCALGTEHCQALAIFRFASYDAFVPHRITMEGGY